MRNLTLLTDLYELTMMYGYYKKGMRNKRAVFDVFFRPFSQENKTYAIAAGLEQALDYLNNLHFEKEDIDYLRSLNLFDEEFLSYLANFRFSCDVWAIPEGTVVFPYEPLVRVSGPIMQAQLVETALLTLINHQTLIATKAARVCHSAQNDAVLEFGLRRAQGPDAGIYGARAAVIGGCVATSNVLCGQMFEIPVKGTHAHSWVMSFNSELEAFRAYADIFPDSCMLLVDTYDVLKSGMPNAITVFRELREKGYEPVGIRLDSGDLAYLSREARRMMDEAGFPNAKVFASSDLDEEVIWDLKAQGACIDVWGVGTRLITSADMPSLGGVYKLSAEIEEDGTVIPKIKVSESPVKITNPGIKNVLRIYDRNKMALADLVILQDETIDPSKPLTIFDPVDTWKNMTVTDYTLKQLLIPVMLDGKQVYECPSLMDIQKHCREDLMTMWEQYRRLHNPHVYKVDLSYKLFNLRQSLLSPDRPRQDVPKNQE